MNEIRAFVGHSFLDDDKPLVDAFLKSLDSLTKIVPHFSWDSASAAEPKELSAKVLSLIEDKNVFIGICTRRERVIEDRHLQPTGVMRGYLKAKVGEFQWKTTDWLLQEIGMAKGLGLDLILLVENGVRPPGGLQGDVEYIKFDRDAPHKAFDKIIEMVAALTPKKAGGQATSPESGTPDEDQVSQKSDGLEILEPAPDWKTVDFERAAFVSIVREDAVSFDRVNSAYLSTTEAEEEDNRAAWHSHVEFLRILFGKGGDLEKLKELSKKYPDNVRVLANLAKATSRYENSESAREFEAAAAKAPEGNERCVLLGKAAEQYAKAGASKESSRVIDLLRSGIKGDGEELTLLNAMREVASVTNDGDLRVGVLERIVQLSPDDVEERFSLAYQHSQLDNDDIALFHYLKIPRGERSSTTWNNLGVAYNQFNLPVRAVASYRQAEDLEDTLAMSNLGYKLLSAGFLSEAQAECDKALKIADYHQNIASLLVRIREVPDEEDEAQKKALEKAKPKADFYRMFGRAVSRSRPDSLSAFWTGPRCELKLERDGTALRFSGTYAVSPNPLSVALGGIGLTRTVTHTIAYEGMLQGQAITAAISRSNDGPKSLLDSADIKTKALMILNDDLSEIKVMEAPHGYSTDLLFP